MLAYPSSSPWSPSALSLQENPHSTLILPILSPTWVVLYSRKSMPKRYFVGQAQRPEFNPQIPCFCTLVIPAPGRWRQEDLWATWPVSLGSNLQTTERPCFKMKWTSPGQSLRGSPSLSMLGHAHSCVCLRMCVCVWCVCVYYVALITGSCE